MQQQNLYEQFLRKVLFQLKKKKTFAIKNENERHRKHVPILITSTIQPSSFSVETLSIVLSE